MTKDLFSSRTFWFNAITIVLGVLEVITKTYPIPPEAFVLIMGIGNLILRMLTEEKIGSIGGLRFSVDKQ